MEGMPLEQFNYLPLSIYIKAFSDFGYVQNYPYYDEKGYNQLLSNRFLGTAGVGMDFVTMYDMVFRFEYTLSQLRPQGGFFFNVKKEF